MRAKRGEWWGVERVVGEEEGAGGGVGGGLRGDAGRGSYRQGDWGTQLGGVPGVVGPFRPRM